MPIHLEGYDMTKSSFQLHLFIKERIPTLLVTLCLRRTATRKQVDFILKSVQNARERYVYRQNWSSRSSY